MKMQFKKIVAAGTLSALMMGSTVGFAALSNFPSPFVTSNGVQSYVVVGAAAAPSDVVGAVDLAARLGGSVTTDVAVPGAVSGFSLSGEGKTLDTTTTHVFLQDNMGKTGLRTTLTKDDLPTLLAKGSFADTDGTHRYDQYIDMTPGTDNAANYRVDFDKPGSSSSADPTYNFGRFTTSPSATEFLYKVRVVFDVAVNDTNSVGKSLKLFGNDYTISADTDFDSATQKLVLFGGADVQTLTGGQSITTTVSGTSYDIKLLGVTSSGQAVVQVGGTSETINKGSTSSNFGDLKIYVKDTASLSTTDQTQNVATLLVGADKLTLQDGSKVKKGNNDDNVDGTLVDLGIDSSEKLSTITIYFAARSSTDDFVAAGNSAFKNQVFNTFGVAFPGASPAVGGASDDHLTIKNSGDNNLQLTMTDYSGYTATINYGYKATSGAQDLSLADSSGNAIRTREGATIARDEYIVLDAGGFPHMFKVSSVSLDGSSSASIDLQDVFSGATTKVTTGTDNNESAVIDGQTYNFVQVSASTFTVTWGTGSNLSAPGAVPSGRGTYYTIWPKLKTKYGSVVSFMGNNASSLPFNTTYELPTGAVQVNYTMTGDSTHTWTLTSWNREDGTTSSANLVSTNNATAVNFQLGRTSTGGLYYRATKETGGTFNLAVLGASNGTVPVLNATVALFEEKDDAGSQGAAFFPGATGSSGSNYLAGVGSVGLSGTNSGSQSWGSNSNKASTADLWGTVVVRDTSTSAQPWVDVWYPDTQRVANLYVVGKDTTLSATTGAGGSTVKSATPVKTPLGKLDTEITTADKSTKNLILVGGPAVNTLVAALGTAGKTKDVTWYRAQGAGTALVDLVADAFASGKSALVVAGYEAADTRTATQMLQNYDAYTWSADRVVIKNGVISTTTA